MVPGTVEQLTILLILVLPGVFYQAVRERLRGALASEQEPQNRLVRAVAAGALLDTLYAVVAGPWLVRLLAGGGEGPVAGVLRQPRQAGLAALLLIVAVPSALAWAEAAWGRRRARARYEPTPTAWDALFRDRGSCFVRVRLKSGLWVGVGSAPGRPSRRTRSRATSTCRRSTGWGPTARSSAGCRAPRGCTYGRRTWTCWRCCCRRPRERPGE